MTKSTKQKKPPKKKQLVLSGKKGSLKNSDKGLILKLPVSKKILELDYWKEYMKMNAPENPSDWDVVNEVIIPKNSKDLLGFGFDSEEDISFLKIPK